MVDDGDRDVVRLTCLFDLPNSYKSSHQCGLILTSLDPSFIMMIFVLLVVLQALLPSDCGPVCSEYMSCLLPVHDNSERFLFFQLH